MPLKSLTLPIDIDEQLCEVHVPCLQLKVMLRSWILWLLTTVVQLQNTHMVQRGQKRWEKQTKSMEVQCAF